jgi:hypothetical protein
MACVEEATAKTSKVGEVDVPSTVKVALGVVEPIPTLWLAVTLKTEMPVEEAMLSKSMPLAAPWIARKVDGEVEPKPMLPALASVTIANLLVIVEEAVVVGA